MPWIKDPNYGGVKIPKTVQGRTRDRITMHAEKHYAGRFIRLDIRFRGKFCYIDAYREPDITPGWPPEGWHETREEMAERIRNTPKHLCRLRYFGNEDRWSLAFFTYGTEKYIPCAFRSGDFYGTPEEGFDVGGIHLRD